MKSGQRIVDQDLIERLNEPFWNLRITQDNAQTSRAYSRKTNWTNWTQREDRGAEISNLNKDWLH